MIYFFLYVYNYYHKLREYDSYFFFFFTIDNSFEDNISALIHDHPCERRNESRRSRFSGWFRYLRSFDIPLFNPFLVLRYHHCFFLTNLAWLVLNDLFVFLDFVRLFKQSNIHRRYSSSKYIYISLPITDYIFFKSNKIHKINYSYPFYLKKKEIYILLYIKTKFNDA